MALTHTILAVLANSPCSGYDISKRFEEGVSCFWKASQQQIYRELSKMEKQALAHPELVPQEGKPDKKIYHITPEGKAELLRWFSKPSEPTPIREDLLVRVLAGPHVPIAMLRQEVLSRRQLHEQQLKRYREKEQVFLTSQKIGESDEKEMCIQGEYRYLTLRRGIRYEQNWIEWCDEVLAFLAEKENESKMLVMSKG